MPASGDSQPKARRRGDMAVDVVVHHLVPLDVAYLGSAATPRSSPPSIPGCRLFGENKALLHKSSPSAAEPYLAQLMA